MIWFAQRKSVKNGQVTFNQRTDSDRDAMLRQYFLYCASAATNEAENEFDFVDFGTVEGGAVKRESFNHPAPAPEPEPEPTPEPEAE